MFFHIVQKITSTNVSYFLRIHYRISFQDFVLSGVNGASIYRPADSVLVILKVSLRKLHWLE
jgi:hypothetical protein